MHDRINMLSILLLGEPLKDQKAKRMSERNVKHQVTFKTRLQGPQDIGLLRLGGW